MPDELPVVVAAAIVARRGNRLCLLAAQRSQPPELAGWWEFPGGKVEVGETELEALVRECREELGVDVVLGDRLGEDLPTVDGRAVLRVWAARVPTGDPRALEHLAIRWLCVDEIYDVRWLPQDRPLVGLLWRRLLGDHC